MPENTEAKVFYGLSNVHYAKLTESVDAETGKVTTTYGTVKAWPGAVNIQLDPSGNPTFFSADNIAYYALSNNRGYEGDYECAAIPDDVQIDNLGRTKDQNGLIVETDKDEVSYFALMFEFETDISARRYCFYKVCLAQRPSVKSGTVDVNSDLSVQTESVKFRAVPRTDAVTIDGVEKHLVKCCTGKDTDPEAYANFYSAVPEPTFETES